MSFNTCKYILNSQGLRWIVPITVILVLVFQGGDVHVSSMEFLERFGHSRLLIINNKALAVECRFWLI